MTITRREVGLLVGAAISGCATPVQSQQSRPVIGFLSSRSLRDSAHLLRAFYNGLADAGVVPNQEATVLFRWADGEYERLDALARDLVEQRVAVIVAVGGEPAGAAALRATSTTPVVFGVGGDPIKSGFVKSLSHPGGNATGVSLLTSALETKRLNLLHELVPRGTLVAALVDPRFQHSRAQVTEIEEAARALGASIHLLYADDDGDLHAAIAIMRERRAGALLVAADPFFDTRRDWLVASANRLRIPAIYQFREYAVAGGLMSYGVDVADAYRNFGRYAGRVLKGAKPGDLPVLQSAKFEFVINVKTARELGIEIPASLLARADEVIE